MMQRLYRSRTERKIAGVCGGMATYFDIDPVIIRLFCLLFVFFGGAGVIMYVIAWFVIPLEPWFVQR
ncbi:MAG: PspC domain-containing protein [Candidatus Babeliales bacterium]|jgi:phage shock protein PspC (stress-responsive transcriptional regulator)